MKVEFDTTDLDIKRIVDYFKSYKKIGIAFSGGVDSALSAVMAKKAVGAENVRLYTVIGDQTSKYEKRRSAKVAGELGLSQEFIEFSITAYEKTSKNDELRCYYCKRAILGKIISTARSQGFDDIFEGSNFSDLEDYRPGFKAVCEMKVKSPLCELGIAKKNVRNMAYRCGLSVWDAPALPCLATRIATGTPFVNEDLRKIEAAEAIIANLGFKEIRVRHGGDSATIEVGREELASMDDEKRKIMECRLKGLGYKSIEVDMKGYGRGNMNKRRFNIDYDREKRTGHPEAVLCEFKEISILASIIGDMILNDKQIIGTRCSKRQFKKLKKKFGNLKYNKNAKILYTTIDSNEERKGRCAVISAGSSDYGVSEEAAFTLELLGYDVERAYDCGVAGLHRILEKTDDIEKCDIAVVVAGMDGALPGVLAGLVSTPVISVPTSVGYGAALSGLTPLLSMLNTCSPGVAVVNIDNGFGAAIMASKIMSKMR